MGDPALLSCALWYAQKGWYVFPIHGTAAGLCSCGDAACKNPGKHPIAALAPQGVKNATTDPQQITQWWTAATGANIAIATGPSGLLVLDVDGPAGEIALAAKDLPLTAEATTARGRHLYFHGEGRSTAGRLGEKLDTRGSGGYVIAPPSAHASGAVYAWTRGPWEGVAELPASIAAALGAPAQSTATSTGGDILAGSRNATLTSLAGSMRRRGLDGPAIAAALHEHNVAHCNPPLEPREVDSIARSVDRYEPTALVVVPKLDARAAAKTIRTQAKRIEDDPALLEDAVRHTAEHVQAGTVTVAEVASNFERALAQSPLVRVVPRPEIERMVAEAPAIPREQLPWQAELAAGDDGPAYGPENFGRLLEQHPDFAIAWNTRFQRSEWLRCPWDPTASGAVGDCSFELRRWVQRTLGWPKLPTDPLEALSAVAAKCPFEPWRVWLDGLRWDGQPRLATAAERLLRSDTPQAGTLFAWWLISAVARTYQPGCQVDHMIVLEGPLSGEGKTTFLRELAVDPQFYTRLTTTGDLGSFRAIGKIHGPVIVEVAEMAALRGRDVESTKAWIDERVDRWQPAYARGPIDSPRTCVFAATVNPGQYLHDDRNRRFWPIACGEIDIAATRAEREQLWAEAVQLYRAGERWYPTAEESARLGLLSLQDSRREIDLIEEMLREALTRPRVVGINPVTGETFEAAQLDSAGLIWVTAPQLMRMLGTQAPKQGSVLSRAMRALGWKAETWNGKKAWKRPGR